MFRTPTLAKATGGEPRTPQDWCYVGLDAWMSGSAVSEWYPVGTCRMGTGVGAGVDSLAMAVHDVAGLFVADASVMPTITRGNTQAPTIMIAERAANHIAKATA